MPTRESIKPKNSVLVLIDQHIQEGVRRCQSQPAMRFRYLLEFQRNWEHKKGFDAMMNFVQKYSCTYRASVIST